MNAFFKAQFNYCPVIWMFHSRSLNNKKIDPMNVVYLSFITINVQISRNFQPGYLKTWGTPLRYPIGVPIGAPLKKYRPEQITVKELKADIRR